MAWSDWAAGVLRGIGAPLDHVNTDTLWAWSNAESGSDVMRWNNPLNTTLPWLSPPSHPMNSVGVQAYLDEASGIAATVDTLLNGYYPIILDHLRRSVPRSQWQDACPNLGTWGTGCGWLSAAYTAAPVTLSGEFGTMDDQAILDQFNFLSKKLSDIGTALQNDIAAVKADVDALKLSGSSPEAPEPAEPKTLSVTIPAQTLTGTLS